MIFGIPSVASIFFTRTYILPALPAQILSIGSFVLTKNILLMLIFALLMVLASYSMIKKDKVEDEGIIQGETLNYPLIFMQGIYIGVITGLIGAGGGFLIIPALVNLLKLPMKTAVGTSLVIIAINALMGFLFSLWHTEIAWGFLLSVVFIAVIGILIGSYLSAKINGKKLKPVFGWFVLVMGIYIIVKEILFI